MNLDIEDLRIDVAARRVWLGDRFVRLRNKEFDLLLYFLKNVGRVLSRSELLEGVWDQNMCCSTNTVDVHVSTLRRRLRNSDFAALLETVHCVGYLLKG